MQGEYRGDFTRDTFDPLKHFSRVLMQQGRVQLDADWNEQAAILLHYLQALAEDLIGPYGGPLARYGFEIGKVPSTGRETANLTISAGNYYLAGILCQNEKPVTYFTQPDPPVAAQASPLPAPPILVYLDVWERHVTYIEDEDVSRPNLREAALGGPDTATRAKVVWQVKVTTKTPPGISMPTDKGGVENNWAGWVAMWQPSNRGQLKAMAKADPKKETDPCIVLPEAHYRGAENQLYRVEIHHGGTINAGKPTFKWSRENSAAVFPILKLALAGTGATNTVTLAHLGRDSRSGLAVGDWVEILNDDYVLHNRTELLLQVSSIDRGEMKVTLKGTTSVSDDQTKHLLLRRWDQQEGNAKQGGLTLEDGAALVKEGSGEKDNWLTLEDGVQIQFQKPTTSGQPNHYRTGDYWLIPARTATGDVEWPKVKDTEGKLVPDSVPPHGVEHHYAPLAVIKDGGAIVDCRRKFGPLGT